MQTLVLLATVVVIAQAENVLEKWLNFKLIHNKQYETDEEEITRFRIFAKNLETIIEHNRNFEHGLETHKLGINTLADLNKKEFLGLLALNSTKPNLTAKNIVSIAANPNLTLEDSVDWRTKGAVTGVKYQGICGSCWSFSTTGSLEGAYFRKHSTLVTFSEQQLIDCDKHNSGCGGGWMPTAFKYIMQHGITSESKYPYQDQNNAQSHHRCKKHVGIVTKIKQLAVTKSNSEDDLKHVVAKYGPVSVAVDATNLQFYSSGVYHDDLCSSTIPNHAMLVVGYGSANGLDYWIVKNSWGTIWGEGGYVRMSRNKENNCGIATYPYYPIL